MSQTTELVFPFSDTIEFVAAGAATAQELRGPVRPAPAQDRVPTRGLCLRGRSITLQHGPDLFQHRAYSVLIDYCKDEDTDRGVLFTFDDSFEAIVGKRSISVWLGTDRGERTLVSRESGLAAKEWHRLALIFSGSNGRAALYINGAQVAAVDDLHGARQRGNFFASPFIGCPHGRSFTGRIDNFQFFDGALKQQDLP